MKLDYSFLTGFVLIVPFGIWHRIKSYTREKLDWRQEGLFILFTLRLSGLAGMLAITTYCSDSSAVVRSNTIGTGTRRCAAVTPRLTTGF